MSIDRELVHILAEIASDRAATRPAAVGTLVAAATEILLEDIGPAGAIETLELLVTSTREIFGTEETVQ